MTRKQEQIKKLELKPTDQPDIYERVIIGGYKTVNGNGEALNDIVLISTVHYKWEGGNFLYLHMHQTKLDREVYEQLKKEQSNERILH